MPSSFIDVPEGSDGQQAIEKLAQLGLMGGQVTPEGRRFFPERAITRREFAIVLDRMNIGELLNGYLPPASAPAPEDPVTPDA